MADADADAIMLMLVDVTLIKNIKHHMMTS